MRDLLVKKLTEWFKTGGVDFWCECNAPEELADVVESLYIPQLRIAFEALEALAHVTQPPHARWLTQRLRLCERIKMNQQTTM